jgi:hypothetical protein
MYLSDDNNIKYILNTTGLSLNELEQIVGRFHADHHAWPKKLKGEFIETWDGDFKIVHHFTKKVLWRN